MTLDLTTPQDRLPWVIRDLVDPKGPQYGCGINACMVCTSHLDGDSEVTDADLDEIRNVCRCGTYDRIPEAFQAGAQNM